MTIIRLAGFAGENRAKHPLLLPETVGVLSKNQKPGRGDLRPWKSPSTVASVPSGRSTIYRMGRDTASDSNYWLSWTGVVHVASGLDAEDTTERTYYSGDGAPKATDNTIALATTPYPTASRALGVPAPASACSVSTDSGTWTGDDESYYYVYTYVSSWGWESAPGPVSAVNTRPVDATATVNGFASVPAGNYGITAIRIYRTQTGASGATEFFFLREIAVATTSTADDNRTLGEVLSTASWLPAPGVPQGGSIGLTETNLSFLTPMWNGMLAGIVGNSVRVCESYYPYAWPIAYDIVPADGKPIGIGVFGQQMLVLTTGKPLLVVGSTPDSLDQQPLEIQQGCIAPASIVSMGSGVAWASNDGLVWYGAGGTRLLTEACMTREDWQALVPSTITGCMYEGLYMGSYDDGSGRKGFFIDPANPDGIYFLETGYATMCFDKLQDQLYVLDSTSVKKWDVGSSMTVQYKSKVFKTSPINLGAAEVTADSYPLTFKLYADGVLKVTKTVTSGEPFRLPGGYSATQWQIELSGAAAMQMIQAAESMEELL